MNPRKPIYWIFGINIILLLFLLSCSNHTNSNITGSPANSGNSIFNFLSSSSPNQKSLLFINFDTQSDDNLPWGSLGARVLHYKIRYAPNELLYMPSYLWLIRDLKDAQTPHPETTVIPLESEIYYAKAYGVDNILHGGITKQGDSLAFNGKIYNVPKSTYIADINQTGSVADPADFFNKLGIAVLDALKIERSPEINSCLQKKNTGNSDAFQIALKAFSLSSNDDKTAVNDYQQAINKDADFIFAYLEMSDRMSSYDLDKSINVLKNALDSFPENSSIQMQYIFANREAAKTEPFRKNELIHQATDMLQRNPENLPAMISGAQGYVFSNDYKNAFQMIEHAVKSYPNCWLSHSNNGYVSAMYVWSVQKGRAYSDLNKEEARIYDKYIPIYLNENQASEKLHPNSTLVLTDLLDSYCFTGKDQKMIEEVFTRATAINPHAKDPYVRMNSFYGGYSNQYQKSRDILMEAFRLNPDAPNFAFLLLDNYQWYKNNIPSQLTTFSNDTQTFEDARNLLHQIAETHPDNQRIIWKTAEFYYNNRDYQQAWYYYEKLPDPPEPIAWNEHEYYLHKAWSASGVGNGDKVIEYADKCLAANPCEICGPNACLIKGEALIDKKNFDEGFGLIEKGIQWNPKITSLYSEYAFCAGQYDYNVDQGFTYIKKALEMNPKDARNWAILARLYVSKNDKQNALANIEKAIQMNPSDKWFSKVKKKALALP